MAISYIISDEEIMLLYFFLGYDKVFTFKHSHTFDSHKTDELLKGMQSKEMVRLKNEKVLFDPVIKFLLKGIVEAKLIVRNSIGTTIYINEKIGIVRRVDPRSEKRYILKPLPNANEIVEDVYEEMEVIFESDIFDISTDRSDWKKIELNKQELYKEIDFIYKGAL